MRQPPADKRHRKAALPVQVLPIEGRQAMTEYRIYVLNRDEQVTRELSTTVAQDTAALQRAEDAYAGEYAAEVYEGERLVARLGGPLLLDA
jgi:hypothetical protein